MKTFENMSVADCVMQNADLDTLSHEEKDMYIIALTRKLKGFLTITCAMEKHESGTFKELGKLMRKQLNI